MTLSDTFSFSEKKIHLFNKALLRWFEENGRHDLPWRKTENSYKVWISETMLQQTQVSRVIPYFLAFTEAFPTINDLSQAKWDDLYPLWSGLGYYSRARNAQKCAQEICKNYNAVIPQKKRIIAHIFWNRRIYCSCNNGICIQ